VPSKAIDSEKLFQVGRHTEPAFSAMIVDRDSMSSGLLASSLVRDLKCDAVAIRSANLLQALGVRDVDLVIISADVNGRPGAGFDLCKAVSCAHPKIPIVILMDQPSQKAVVKAFRCGARGLFSRQEAMSDFINCIEHVRRGCIWAGREESNFLLNAFRSGPAPIELTEDNASILTTRESQVVRHAATGKTNKTIASEMGLSEHTVKNYLFKAFEKLGVSSRVELLFYLTTCEPSLSGPELDADYPPSKGLSTTDTAAI
jgi:two-component system nitrate/nitrite response regulator NarL